MQPLRQAAADGEERRHLRRLHGARVVRVREEQQDRVRAVPRERAPRLADLAPLGFFFFRAHRTKRSNQKTRKGRAV